MNAAAAGLTFYTNPLAFNPAKVSVMLAEKKLPHKVVKVDLFSGGSLSPEFIRLNPSASVPVLVKDGKTVLESKAICQLLDTLGGPPLGGDKVDRTFVNKFIEEIDTFDGNLWAFAHQPAPALKIMRGVDEFRKKVAAARARENPDLKEVYDEKINKMSAALDASQDPVKADACEKILIGLFDTAEGRLTGQTSPTANGATITVTPGVDERFLGGPAYSIADAMFAPILYRVDTLGSTTRLITPRPALAAYMKRMTARPSWHAAFGEASSTWGKLTNFLPPLVLIQLKTVFRRY